MGGVTKSNIPLRHVSIPIHKCESVKPAGSTTSDQFSLSVPQGSQYESSVALIVTSKWDTETEMQCTISLTC